MAHNRARRALCVLVVIIQAGASTRRGAASAGIGASLSAWNGHTGPSGCLSPLSLSRTVGAATAARLGPAAGAVAPVPTLHLRGGSTEKTAGAAAAATRSRAPEKLNKVSGSEILPLLLVCSGGGSSYLCARRDSFDRQGELGRDHDKDASRPDALDAEIEQIISNHEMLDADVSGAAGAERSNENAAKCADRVRRLPRPNPMEIFR